VTGTLPPWSPLNDPQLSGRLQEKLGSRREQTRLAAQFQMDLLSRYAWQEYPVKYGVWALKETGLTGGTNLSGPWTKRSYEPDYSWILLLDPGSGRPLARHFVDAASDSGMTYKAMPFPAQTTSIWFAGDPRAFGLFSPVGNGHFAFFGSRDRLQAIDAWQRGPQHYTQWAATIGDVLDRDPAHAAANAAAQSLWIADHPQKPSAPGRFSSAGRG
jgi:hypothetical protein